jgi:hypothetical protein
MRELSVHWMSLTGAVLLCWAAVAVHRELLHGRGPRTRFGTKDLPFLGATLVLAALWILTFGGLAADAGTPAATAAALQAGARPPAAGCLSIAPAMKGQQVTAILGNPDSIVNEEDIRGPGATRWWFENARCTVHIIDDVVEFAD